MNKKLIVSLLALISLSSIKAQAGLFERSLSAVVKYSHEYKRALMNSEEKMAEIAGRFLDNHWGKCLLGYLGICVTGAIASRIINERQREKSRYFESGYMRGHFDGEVKAAFEDMQTREIQTQTDFE